MKCISNQAELPGSISAANVITLFPIKTQYVHCIQENAAGKKDILPVDSFVLEILMGR